MAATQTVPQHSQHCNFVQVFPRHGVVTLFGYGINVHVDRGHLTIQDGIGAKRREARLSRVGHGLRRLVVIGSDGMVSLAALRWLAGQDAAFIMLDRDGSVLVTTGPVRPSDARLRRAQALAHQSGTAIGIARELIDRKIASQEALARDGLRDLAAAQTIASARAALTKATTTEDIRYLEAQAGHAYWSAWRSVPVVFPRADMRRVPDHWRSFGTRISPLSGSPRLAVNPPNAILNYLYALLESEARLAIAALGLDPGLGFLHMDKRQAKGGPSSLPTMAPPRPPVVCRVCGITIKPGRIYCQSCAVTASREGLIEAAKLGRVAGHSPEARARQAEKQRRHAAAVKAWNPSDKPDWLTEEVYREKIQPRLAGTTVPVISAPLGVSEPYAAEIRAGRYLPHPRHWLTLARLVGISA